jgi:hypothetical protein
MKTNTAVISTLILVFALAAVPSFAQILGVGLGGKARSGAAAGAPVGGADVGVKTRTDIDARTSARENAGAGVQSNAGVAGRIESNPQLASRVQGMLPSDESLTTASAGFKNQGQFLAALHASHNLKIPFDDLKAKMTGSDAMSLGTAIRASKPQMSKDEAKEEAKKAETEARITASAGAKARTTNQ